MATNFSPCKGSYLLNHFPSIVMFGMKGFYVSTSGAIQGHRGLLLYIEPALFPQAGKEIMLNVLALRPSFCLTLSHTSTGLYASAVQVF